MAHGKKDAPEQAVNPRGTLKWPRERPGNDVATRKGDYHQGLWPHVNRCSVCSESGA